MGKTPFKTAVTHMPPSLHPTPIPPRLRHTLSRSYHLAALRPRHTLHDWTSPSLLTPGHPTLKTAAICILATLLVLRWCSWRSIPLVHHLERGCPFWVIFFPALLFGWFLSTDVLQPVTSAAIHQLTTDLHDYLGR